MRNVSGQLYSFTTAAAVEGHVSQYTVADDGNERRGRAAIIIKLNNY